MQEANFISTMLIDIERSSKMAYICRNSRGIKRMTVISVGNHFNNSKKSDEAHVNLHYKMSLVLRKLTFLHMLKQRRRSATAQLVGAFVFTAYIVRLLLFLNPNFQASSHLLWLYSPICVRRGRKPLRLVFSHKKSLII